MHKSQAKEVLSGAEPLETMTNQKMHVDRIIVSDSKEDGIACQTALSYVDLPHTGTDMHTKTKEMLFAK